MLDIGSFNASQESEQQITPQPVVDKKDNEQQKTRTFLDDSNDFMLDDKTPQKILFYFTLAVLIMMIGFWIYLYFAKATKAQELIAKEKEQTEINAKLNAPEMREIETIVSQFSGGIEEYKKIVTTSPIYLDIFKYCEQITPIGVKYDSFIMDEKGAVILSASASNPIDLANFAKSLEKSKNITLLTVNNLQTQDTTETKNSTINLAFTLNLNNFLAKNININQTILDNNSNTLEGAINE